MTESQGSVTFKEITKSKGKVVLNCACSSQNPFKGIQVQILTILSKSLVILHAFILVDGALLLHFLFSTTS